MLNSTATSKSKYSSQGPFPSASHAQSLIPPRVTDEQLIKWLVAAKRSLSSIHHVQRATTTLAQARLIIEKSTALITRTRYLRKAVDRQLRLLRGIQYKLEESAYQVKQEISNTVRQLELTTEVLYRHVNTLKSTNIEQGFQPRRDHNTPDRKNVLYDFIDAQPMDELLARAQTFHHATGKNASTIDTAIRELEGSLQSVNGKLAVRTTTSSSTESDLKPLHIPKLLSLLEENATDMAQALDSLGQHFDSCVRAVRQSEGGELYLAQNDVAVPSVTSLHSCAEHDPEADSRPLTPTDHAALLAILAQDAQDLPEVILDIQSRAADIEIQFSQLEAFFQSTSQSYHSIASAYALLTIISSSLPAYLLTLHTFQQTWIETHQPALADLIANTEDLSLVYERFSSAYDAMIIEAARRKQVRKKMERVVDNAMKELDALCAEDDAERNVFREERGMDLPQGIWDGLDGKPARWEVRRLKKADERGKIMGAEGLTNEDVGEGDADEWDSVPELNREVVQAALKRLRAQIEG